MVTRVLQNLTKWRNNTVGNYWPQTESKRNPPGGGTRRKGVPTLGMKSPIEPESQGRKKEGYSTTKDLSFRGGVSNERNEFSSQLAVRAGGLVWRVKGGD